MPSDKVSYSSEALRARDKRVQENYDKQTSDLLKRKAYEDDARNLTIFELQNRCQRLANLLGYANISEAIMEIETADVGATFRQCLHRLQTTETELDVKKMEIEILELKYSKLKEAHLALEGEKRFAERAYRQLDAEHQNLKARYGSLNDVKMRAQDRYKGDYAKWKAFYRWMISDGPDEDHPEVSLEVKKLISKVAPAIAWKRQAIIDGKINLSFMEQNRDSEGGEEFSTPANRPPPLGGIEMESDSDSVEIMSSPSAKKRRFSKVSSSPKRLAKSPLKSATPSVASNKARKRLANSPLKSVMQSFSPMPPSSTAVASPLVDSITKNPNIPSSPIASQHIPASSDTEYEDTQSIWIPMARPIEPPSFTTPISMPIAGSSKLIPNTDSTPRPKPPRGSPVKKRPRTSLADPPRQKSRSPSKKLRRQSVHEIPSDTPDNFFANGKGKDRQDKENCEADKYSIFKGHGRYGKAKEPENTSINAGYVIDPANNGGLDYQYDEVIRSRDARKKMHAGDCECCREYYEAVGPLPTRLQQPLWRSPKKSPQRAKGARSTPSRQSEIDSHKKAISRHRHTWARAPTPPGYWDIGFPNTQEVSAINAKATEMHKRKKDEVETEAARGGRYKKRTL